MTKTSPPSAAQWYCRLGGLFFLGLATIAAAFLRDVACTPMTICGRPGLIALTASLGGLLLASSWRPNWARWASRLGGLIFLSLTILGYQAVAIAVTVGVYTVTISAPPAVPLNFIYLTAGLIGLIVGFDLTSNSRGIAAE